MITDVQTKIDKLTDRSDFQISEIVDAMISSGVELRASDVHVEPLSGVVYVRYRIDGVLMDAVTLPFSLHPRITSRIKVMAKMLVYQKDVPQDGHIDGSIYGSGVDLRVASFPTIHGEKVLIRIFDPGQVILDVRRLGFLPRMLKEFEDLLLRRQGTIILTGPASSGKTTTIYSAIARIQELREGITNIVTLEDPVEYNLRTVSQTEVSPERGLTFDAGLRAILRHDPEVIVVGEIRDVQTARIAIQAGLSGHLVITTVHSPSAAGVFARLIQMEVEPFLISSSVIGVLAQRLVRKVCSNCVSSANQGRRLTARGCKECAYTGYKGRTLIAELLTVNDFIRDLIVKKCTSGELEIAARKSGMRSLKEDGTEKVERGITSVEEVERVIA
jgi:type II secretory ATPase GspE/PulE/Tfp pilus assembly ATPase PilB-like protein